MSVESGRPLGTGGEPDGAVESDRRRPKAMLALEQKQQCSRRSPLLEAPVQAYLIASRGRRLGP